MTSLGEQERRRRVERARAIALFRYGVIQEVIDPQLSPAQRGRRVRELASQVHTGPFGEAVSVSKQSINRWRLAYRQGGFDALVPQPRQATPRTPVEVMDLAAALKRENPQRTASQVQRILRATSGWAPSDRTLQRLFERLELGREVQAEPRVFGRFQADRPNELWTGDALHGPRIGGRKTYLFCFIDDHSRAVMGGRWAFHEDVVRLAAALRPALASHGVPESVYVDNGSAFVDAWLLRACASLGIRLVHSAPGRPQGRGKVERFFRTVRDQFLVEINDTSADQIGTAVADLAELNRLFTAWVQTGYHQQIHSETGQMPLARWLSALPAPLPLPSPAQLREAFLWSERRMVTKTATVSLHGNTYEVDPILARKGVELVFDPFDLTDIQVRHHGVTVGKATPFTITRHCHRKTRGGKDNPDSDPAAPQVTGIDYLRLLDDAHGRDLQKQINYAALLDGGQPGDPAGDPRRHEP